MNQPDDKSVVNLWAIATHKILTLIGAFLTSAVAGGCLYILSTALAMPRFYADPMSALTFAAIMCLTWLVAYFFIPALVLAVISLLRGWRLAIYLLIPALWLIVVFFAVNKEIIIKAGYIPFEYFLFDYVYQLPAMLVSGWVFGRVVRSRQV